MQRTSENLAWMAEQLGRMAHLTGYPPNAASLAAVANAYLDILHVETPETEVDHIYPGEPGRSLGKVKPAYWLIEKLVQMSDRRFPTPPVARRVYTVKFPAGDRKSPYGPTDAEMDALDGN